MPIAGLSSRFRPFTSDPKWSLKVGGKTVLERALDTILLEQSLYISQVIFVVHEKHFALLGSMKYRESAISELGQILTVNQTPNGQALSAVKALNVIADDSGFVISNGDSAISQG
jgi:CTP:molybdopterin cytidylyltransferase MocA